MLKCLSVNSSSSSKPTSPPLPNNNSHQPFSQGVLSDDDTAQSPTFNLSTEYSLAVQTNSYKEMFVVVDSFYEDQDVNFEQQEVCEETQERLLAKVLQPDRGCVEKTLGRAKDRKSTRLVSTYFKHGESTCNLCILLHQNLRRARDIYAPLIELLSVLPSDACSLSESQCNRVYELFVRFDSQDNPFPSPDSDNFNEMRRNSLELEQQLRHQHWKSKSRVQLFHRTLAGSALCLVGTAVAGIIAAVTITTHAVLAFVTAPCITAYLPGSRFTKRELAVATQLNAAAKGACVLKNSLDTIDRLVNRLYTFIEDDKFLIRIGLERGQDGSFLMGVVNQLRKNHTNFRDQVRDLEEHIFRFFAMVNRDRVKLLKEIDLQQTFIS